MKRNTQRPNLNALWIIRVLALKVTYRLAFMFLKMKQSSFVEKMKKNSNKSPAATVKNHRRKILFLIDRMYPHFEYKEAFKKYEKYLRHDLFVKFIMTLSQVGSNKAEFLNCIPQVQWY
jgi:hypothetical protein